MKEDFDLTEYIGFVDEWHDEIDHDNEVRKDCYKEFVEKLKRLPTKNNSLESWIESLIEEYEARLSEDV